VAALREIVRIGSEVARVVRERCARLAHGRVLAANGGTPFDHATIDGVGYTLTSIGPERQPDAASIIFTADATTKCAWWRVVGIVTRGRKSSLVAMSAPPLP